MVTAYAIIANGGRKISPTLIDRIQDRFGETIYQHDQRVCEGCAATAWHGPGRAGARRQSRAGARPDDRLPDHLDDGGRRPARHRRPWSRRSASRSPARPAPPTTTRTPGSSASRPTSWSASIIGYDKPRPLGRGATGGAARGADLHRVHEDGAGRRAADAVPRAAGTELHPDRPHARACSRKATARAIILEAFKPGTGPPDTYSIIGYTDASGRPLTVAPDSDRAVISGTGGLY